MVETIYRIEHRDKGHGMWYNESGQYDPFVRNLSDSRLYDMDMSEDSSFQAGEDALYCGCESLEQLSTWFTPREILELTLGGFAVYKLSVLEATHQQNQVLFQKSLTINQSEIDYMALFV